MKQIADLFGQDFVLFFGKVNVGWEPTADWAKNQPRRSRMGVNAAAAAAASCKPVDDVSAFRFLRVCSARPAIIIIISFVSKVCNFLAKNQFGNSPENIVV